tara:strand:+ start:615 stop:2597 length:1983 start_codon:yes stop_codon:yes gene_type:complete
MAPSKNVLNLKKYLKLPSGDLFLTIVIVISYLLTRGTYENQSKSKIGKNIISRINKRTGLKFQMPSDLTLFKMNNHYKRADKKISDVLFICLLAFFVFKMKWNNTDSFTNEQKLAWVSSVLISPLIINIFLENKNKVSINPERVSNLKEMKKSNNQTKVFLIFSILLTIAVVVKLAHRIIVCKGGIEKPIIIQMIIIGTTIGLHFLANKDIEHHNSVTSNNRINYQFKKEQQKYAEQFDYEWEVKHYRVLNRLNSKENRFDNDKDDFVPISKIIQLVREKSIENSIEYAKNRVIKGSRSNDKLLFKLKGLSINNKDKLKNVWPYIKNSYDNLKLRYERFRTQIPAIIQSKDSKDKIISISNKGVPETKNGVSENTEYYKNLAYTIISEYLELNSKIIKKYDTLVDRMKDVIYTRTLSFEFRYGLDENNRFGKYIFNHKLDGTDFKKQFEENLKKLPVSSYQVKYYPSRNYSKIKNTSITERMLEYYSMDDKKLETFEDFIKYHKKKVKENMYKYRNIKGDKPTLEDVKKNDVIEIRNNVFDKVYYHNQKDSYIQDHITATTHGAKLLPLGSEWVYKDYVSHYKSGKPRNDLNGNSVSLTNFEKSFENKSVTQHGWVIVFLLILSFTVCRKDTIDYIIEGSLWGYLIQNIARWDDISPDLM